MFDLSKVTVSLVLFVIFSVKLFLIDFNLIMLVTCSFMSKSFIITIPDYSSTNRASTTTIFCTFGWISVFSLGKNRMDLFRKLKQELHESITPSSSKTFLIPKTKSTFTWISETRVKLSNLCL